MLPLDVLPRFDGFQKTPKIALHFFHGKVERDGVPNTSLSVELGGRVSVSHVYFMHTEGRIDIFRNGREITRPDFDAPPVAPGFEQAPRVAICCSAGGVAGLYTAMTQRFDFAIGLSALTDARPEAAVHDPRLRRYGPLIREAAGGWAPDMLETVAEHGVAGEIHLCYPARQKADAYQAERMGGCAGITLHPISSRQHALRAGRPLLSVVEHMLALDPVDAAAA